MTIKSRLKIMIFLQFFVWGCWLITLGSYMINTLHFSGAQVGAVYGSSGLASLIMPSLIGIIADRWIKANRLYGISHFLGAIFLFIAAQTSDPTLMFWVMFFNAMVYHTDDFIILYHFLFWFRKRRTRYHERTSHLFVFMEPLVLFLPCGSLVLADLS